jgi:excisionase family DNA binding protein
MGAPTSPVALAPEKPLAPAPSPTEPTYSTKETARLLGLCAATVYKLCSEGKLEHKRNGVNAIRISASAIRTFQAASS